jgi:hypothetical protein
MLGALVHVSVKVNVFFIKLFGMMPCMQLK